MPLRLLRVEGGLTADGVEMYIAASGGGTPRGELFVHSTSVPAVDRATQLSHQFFPSLKKTFFKVSESLQKQSSLATSPEFSPAPGDPSPYEREKI